jgi:hypothetical protein
VVVCVERGLRRAAPNGDNRDIFVMMDVWSKQPYSRITLKALQHRHSASGQDSRRQETPENEKTIHDYHWCIILAVDKV